MKRPSQKKLKKNLFDAVYDDNLPAVFEALSDGVDIDARDEDGWTALMIAADKVSAGSGWVLRELLRMGANPALAAHDGTTALMLAAVNNHAELLPLQPELVAARDDSGQDALIYAATEGKHQNLRLFLAHGATPLTQDENGWTALHHAANAGHAECVYHLLKSGAPVNAVSEDGLFTPLHLAVQSKHARCVQQLLRYGADVHCTNGIGQTPLSAAAEGGLVECLRLILHEHPNLPEAALNMAMQIAVEEGHAECLRMLLRHGGNPSAHNEDGLPLLCQSAFYGQTDCVEILLEHGVSVNETDAQGHTPLYHASGEGRTVCAEYLMEHGATPLPAKGILDKLSRFGRKLGNQMMAAIQEIPVDKDAGETLLMVAAAQGRIDFMRQALKDGDSVNDANGHGWTALHYAAFHGQEEAVAFLLKKGADPLWQETQDDDEDDEEDDEEENDNEKSDTPIQIALERGHAACLQLMLEAVDTPQLNEWLCTAASHGRIECIEVLLNAGGDISTPFIYQTPLICAAAGGHCTCLKYLLSKGAELQQRALNEAAANAQTRMVKLLLELGLSTHDKPGTMTPLMEAAQGGSAECVQLLLEHGAKPNTRGTDNWPMLIFASLGTNAECTRLLLQAGAKPDSRSKVKLNALHYAVFYNQPGTVAVLLEHKADPTLRDNSLHTALDTAIRYDYTECIQLLAEYQPSGEEGQAYLSSALEQALTSGKAELAQFLIQQGADPHAVNDVGFCHLMHAARSGNPDCVRLMLAQGVSVKPRGTNATSALHMAAESGSAECVQLLLDAGADLNSSSLTCPTPLHYALDSNHLECAQLLLERGAEPDTESSPGYTPLHGAAAASPECLNLILKYGVRVNVREEDTGMTPLMKCARYGLPACAEILLRHGADPHLRNNEGQTALDIARKRGAARIVCILKKAMGRSEL